MADITARLIWYRLGEIADSAKAYILDEDVDVLDLLFAFWIFVAGAVLLIVYGVEWLSRRSRTFRMTSSPNDSDRWSALRRQHSFFLEPEEQRNHLSSIKQQQQQQQASPSMTSPDGIVRSAPISGDQLPSASSTASNGEASEKSCHWLNRLMTWMFLNYSKPPQWLDDWLRTMNEELHARARGQKNSLRFVKLLPGGLPPKLLSFQCEPDDDTRCLFLRGNVLLSEVGFRAQVLPDGRQCDVVVRNLRGQLEAQLRIALGMAGEGEGVRVIIKFGSRPKMEVAISQSSEQNATLPLDIDWIRRQVVRVLEEAVTELSFAAPSMSSKGDSRGVDAVLAEAVAASTSTSHMTTPSVHVTIADDATTSSTEEERVIVPRSSRTVASSASGVGHADVKQRQTRPDKEKSRTPSSGAIPRFFSGQRTFGGAARNSTSNGSVSRPLVIDSPPSTSPDGQLKPSITQHQQPQPASTDASSQDTEPRKTPTPTPPSPSPPRLSSNSLDMRASSQSLQAQRSPSPMTTPIRGLAKGQSVLAKVIKAGGLPSRRSRARDRTLYCVVEMDEPYQRHTTGPVCGSASAFWDQGFVLELNSNSQRITFAVFDGDWEKGTNLGQTVVPLSDLMAHPSSRQIIPLTCEQPRSRSKDRESASQPSLTVEFLFLLPSPGTSGEALLIASSHQPMAVSPQPVPNASSASSIASGQAVTSRDLAEFMAPPDTDSSLGKDGKGRPLSSYLPAPAPKLHLDTPAVSLEPNSVEVLPPERGRTQEPERRHVKRSRSFASKLRRTFGKGKERSKSADRASAAQPEAAAARKKRKTLVPSAPVPNGNAVYSASSHSDLQRAKSSGLSGSFRRLFAGRKAKRHGGSEGGVPSQRS